MRSSRLRKGKMSIPLHRTAIGRVAVGLALAALTVPLVLPVGGSAADRAAHPAAKRAKAKSGHYRGKTDQGRRVSFKVTGGLVKRASYSVRRRGCTATVTFTTPSRIRKNGRFSFGKKSSHYFKGTFVAKREVRGRAGIDFSKTACPGRGVRSVHYRAHHKG